MPTFIALEVTGNLHAFLRLVWTHTRTHTRSPLALRAFMIVCFQIPTAAVHTCPLFWQQHKAEAAANEKKITSQLEQERLLHARDAADFGAVKQNLVEESRRSLQTAVGDARQASEATSRSR